MHHNHAKHSTTTSPVPSSIDIPTQHLHKQMAAKGRGLSCEQVPPSESPENITSTCTSTSTITTAAFCLSTTKTQVPISTPTQLVTTAITSSTTEQFVQQSSRQLSPKPAADSLRPKRVQQLLTCVCSSAYRGYVGLKSHRRSCTVFR